MSIIDELLVILDEQKPQKLEEIKAKLSGKSLQTISSTLGRLVAKGWVKEIIEKPDKKYQITSSGNDEVSSALSEIRKFSDKKWNGKWQIVVFNVPEKERSKRDALRTKLQRMGYGRIENALWISPWDQKNEIYDYASRINAQSRIVIINAGDINKDDTEAIKSKFQWDWSTLNKLYLDFIDQANKFLKNKDNKTYQARLLVYKYAKILVKDPKFPAEVSVKGYSGDRARLLYERVRPFCYAK